MDTDGIILRNINKTYPGVKALDNFNFTIKPGEIHCVVGENGSGKSTFIKILSGVVAPDENAEIIIGGEKIVHHDAASAINAGIQVLYQDMSLFPNLTVAENIAYLSHSPDKKFVNWDDITKVATEAMKEIGFSFNLKSTVETLPVAQRQLVEITRALTRPLRLLILDEPTASLTQKEVNALFRILLKLKAKGISILFVSHKMNEIFEIAEKITVLRDGIDKGTYLASELTQDKLIYLMSGEIQVLNRPKPIDVNAETVLEVKDLSLKDNYADLNFSLKKGEILGITGLLGSGRTELAYTLFGMTTADQGKILLDGKEVQHKSNVEAKNAGICYVSEDRRNLGLVLEQSISDNLTITTLDQFITNGLLQHSKEEQFARFWIDELAVKIGTFDAPADSLSGGNQQKLVLAKWLALNPKILILDQPTIGIDVIAKENIHTMAKLLAEQGMSIILISDELNEIMRNAHRALVMQNGRIVHEFLPDEENEEYLLKEFNLA